MNTPDAAEAIIDRVKNADIKQSDWIWTILLNASDVPDYWKGYLSCYCENLGNSISSNDPAYRDEVVSIMWECWQ